ncbi:hypothetical protein [Microvirga rosea]|uniref:hypothetical protein n=1 Tax=Microvirga rosea TaxID=2715425 RepID=UPI001D0B02C8|nr:hypothetical protein [Microvirga rosea]MCB8819323.1 hypothetical protein [Microvirga rosea]
MKTLLVALSTVVIAASTFAGSAEARPGRGHAYGHYKHHGGYAYGAPRGYYAPRYYRRSNNAAIAAGVTGAIIGGALSAATQPAYRRPAYEPPRRYYQEDYYYDY